MGKNVDSERQKHSVVEKLFKMQDKCEVNISVRLERAHASALCYGSQSVQPLHSRSEDDRKCNDVHAGQVKPR